MDQVRRPLLAGNWKMHGTRAEATSLISAISEAAGAAVERDVLVAPPYTLLDLVSRLLEGTRIMLAAQDLFWEPKGAFTGAISPLMLRDVPCTHVIVGHSERRQYFGETDDTVNKKVHAAVAHDLVPILCIGETLRERQADATLAVIERQVRTALANIGSQAMSGIILAYEPVWAIGTGKVATPAQAQQVHAYIRSLVGQLGGSLASDSCRVLYGGSVKPDNIDALMREADIDGALVGGASLQAAAFTRIVRFQG